MTIISTPQDLITAVPFLLNSYPQNCLVLVALREGVVDSVIQSEIPTLKKLSANDEPFQSLRTLTFDQLLLLIYLPSGDLTPVDDSTWEQLRTRCEEIAPVKDFLIIKDGRWRSFLCKEEECCDSSGEPIPDIESSAIAAEHVFMGRAMPLATSPRHLPPNVAHDESHEDFLQFIEEAKRAVETCELPLRSRRGVVALLRLITTFSIEGEIFPNRITADALVALSDIQVRDFAIGSHGDENLALHIKLWQALLTLAPEGYRAPVATLLALLRYEAGERDGAMDALERALCDNPHYSLAHLLQKTFAAGWPPEAFTTMRHELHPKLRAELLG